MRALTVRQPWASCIALHGKRVENRSWTTSYRGPILIHAGKGVDRLGEADLGWRQFSLEEYDATRKGEATEWADPLPLGAVVAVAELVDVHDAEYGTDAVEGWGLTWCCHEPDGSLDRWAEIPGPGDPDRYVHWVLDDVRPLAEPVPVRGSLGLWTPGDRLAALCLEEISP